THALTRQRKEHHQRKSHERGVDGVTIAVSLRAHAIAQRSIVLPNVAQTVDHAHHRYEDLARGKRTHDTDPDFPVEAKRDQRRLESFAKPPTEAVLEGRGAGFILRERR